MSTIAKLLVALGLDKSDYDKGLGDAEGKAHKSSSAISSLLSGASKMALGAVAAGAAAAMTGLGAAIAISTREAIEAQSAEAQLDAVLKSTGGASGMTRNELLGLADQLQKTTRFSDDSVIAAENLLLTFTKIGKETFPMATTALADIATAMGTDMSAAAIQVGKALNDPIAGISALTRIGVTFSEEQKKVIESLVNTGNVAGAQKVILQELNREFGGSAVAAGQTFAGQWDIIKNKLLNVGETIGRTLLPLGKELFKAISPYIDDLSQTITNFVESDEFKGWISDIANFLRNDLPAAIESTKKAFSDLKLVLDDVGTAVSSISGLLKLLRKDSEENEEPVISLMGRYRVLQAIISDVVWNFYQWGRVLKGLRPDFKDFEDIVRHQGEVFREMTEQMENTTTSGNTLSDSLGTQSSAWNTVAATASQATNSLVIDNEILAKGYRDLKREAREAADAIEEKAAQEKADQLASIASAQAAAYETQMNMVLSASMSGTLTQAATTYRAAVAGLTGTLEENALAQYNALEAMRATTRGQIYQQASQGLSADAALELAKKMGMISEADYVVASSIMQLRAAYDINRDGAISASEGVGQYSEAVRNLYAIVSGAMERGESITSAMFGNLSAGMVGAAGGLPDPRTVMEDIVQDTKDIFKTANWSQVGEESINGIVEGMKSKWSWLTGTAKDMAEAALKAAKEALGIHSRSQVMYDQIGVNMGLGVQGGWVDSMASFAANIPSMFSPMVPALAGAGSDIVNSEGGAWGGSEDYSRPPIYVSLMIAGEDATQFLKPFIDSGIRNNEYRKAQ